MRVYTRLLVSTNHHDLSTFLEYASRTGMSRQSTVFVGTHYEYVAQRSLARLGLPLQRSGGKGDFGIDLRGVWSPPSLPPDSQLRVVGQCKQIDRRSAGPARVRELEGAFAAVSAHFNNYAEDAQLETLSIPNDVESSRGAITIIGTMALLVTPLLATKGIRDAIGRSPRPLAYAMITSSGRIKQLFWNKRCADIGLAGLRVDTRHAPTGVPENEDELVPEVVLTWEGSTWEPDETALTT